MPRNLSAWIDLTIHLTIMLVLIGVLNYYNVYLAAISLVVWLCLAIFARDRCRDRTKRFQRYCRMVIANVNEMMNFAVERLPQASMIVDKEGRLQWCNDNLAVYVGSKQEQNTAVEDFWPELNIAPVWNTEGELVFTHGEKAFKVYHRPIKMAVHQPEFMALYVADVSDFEDLKKKFLLSRTVLIYAQIDNYDEAVQGLNETDRTGLLLRVNQELDKWMKKLNGFMRRVSDDMYVVVLDRKSLDRAMADRFVILDNVRQIEGAKHLPVTLSLGVAVADKQTMEELGSQAQAGLDLALGRGGDQAAVQLNGKTQFFGGKAKAVEKHTRVKARVLANAMREKMEEAEEILVMGHHNEDFDSFGAAMGVVCMARYLNKPVRLVLSDMTEGIDKFIDLIKNKQGYEDLLVRGDDIGAATTVKPLLFVVDTHIPFLTAQPKLLERIHDVIVIDHHRRSENFIKNPLLVYHEAGVSSASELVTELIMYFSDNLMLKRLDATALYAGIVVDTKNFAVQTGVRTFDAASYLRRSGADPVMVRYLFRDDYETTVALAKTKANSEYYKGGLIVATCADLLPNGQIIAAQAADSLLAVENIRMSIVCFQLKTDTIGISARSSGDINVQVIMEAFGGGGHQNVAGAQVVGQSLDEVKNRVIEKSLEYIKEFDQDESNSGARR